MAREDRELLCQYSFARYIYSDNRGRLWSRSIALNIGIREARGEYVFTNDVDMLFPSKVLEYLSEELDPAYAYHVKSNYLDKEFADWGNIDAVPLGGYDGSGRGIMVVPRKHLEKMRGYDEFYFYWGSEDRDLSSRLTAMDIHEKPIPDTIYLHHQWHPSKRTVRLSTFLFYTFQHRLLFQ